MSVFLVSFGSEVPIPLEPGLFRPQVDCARCAKPVEFQTIKVNAGGGLSMLVRCHGSTARDFFEWGDLNAGDLVVGPAFDPDRPLVRRR